MSDLAALQRDLQKLVDSSEPLQHAVGQFGKETALDAVQKDLGADRRMSNMRTKARLSAGYDLGEPVILNLRPAGLWILADKGRKRSGNIFPKKRGGKKAVLGPKGPSVSAPYRPSRGLDTIEDTVKAIDRDIVKAAEKGVEDMIREAGF